MPVRLPPAAVSFYHSSRVAAFRWPPSGAMHKDTVADCLTAHSSPGLRTTKKFFLVGVSARSQIAKVQPRLQYPEHRKANSGTFLRHRRAAGGTPASARVLTWVR